MTLPQPYGTPGPLNVEAGAPLPPAAPVRRSRTTAIATAAASIGTAASGAVATWVLTVHGDAGDASIVAVVALIAAAVIARRKTDAAETTDSVAERLQATTAERMAIIGMLRDGTISKDDAEDLLRTVDLT